MTVILVTSPKGGTGVTALTAELARSLVSGGRDVVAINLTVQPALGYRLDERQAPGDVYATSAAAGVTIAQVDPASARGADRAGFALAHRRDGAVLLVDIAAGDDATREALAPQADLLLCILAADAGSLAVLPQALRLCGASGYCILNLVDERRALTGDAIAVFRRTFGDRLLGLVRQDEAVNEALALLAPLAPGAAASDIAALARRIDGLLGTTAGALPLGDVA